MVRKGLRDPRFHSVRYRRSIFFFQAEDGIRDGTVTGVQTCALPISSPGRGASPGGHVWMHESDSEHDLAPAPYRSPTPPGISVWTQFSNRAAPSSGASAG